MKLPPDFRELLEEFAREGVEHAVVGGYAYAFHVQPRATKDLDLLLGAGADNLERAATATWEGLQVRIIGLDDLIDNKRAAGRPQDVADLQKLQRVRSKKQ